MKRKSNFQPKTEPLRSLNLAVRRQRINVKRIYFERHSKVTVLYLKKEKEEWYF